MAVVRARWVNPTPSLLLLVTAVLMLSHTEPCERCSWARVGHQLDPPPPRAAAEAGPGHCSMEVVYHIHLQVVSAALAIPLMLVHFFW